MYQVFTGLLTTSAMTAGPASSEACVVTLRRWGAAAHEGTIRARTPGRRRCGGSLAPLPLSSRAPRLGTVRMGESVRRWGGAHSRHGIELPAAAAARRA